jgi:hypothetical protein
MEKAELAALQPGWQVSAFLGYGGNLLQVRSYPETGEQKNPLGTGLGLRLRYQLPVGLLLGLRGSHHFGEDDGPKLTLGQLEAGWAGALGPIRGEVFAAGGVERTWHTSELCDPSGNCTSTDQGNSGFAVGLGLGLAFPVAERFFLGVTGEALVALDIIGVSADASVGMAF